MSSMEVKMYRKICFCLCWGFTSRSTIFQSCRDGATASWVINQYFRGVKCLALGHNTAAVGFEPPTSRSRVWHSTTEPPRSPCTGRKKGCTCSLVPLTCSPKKIALFPFPKNQNLDYPCSPKSPLFPSFSHLVPMSEINAKVFQVQTNLRSIKVYTLIEVCICT